MHRSVAARVVGGIAVLALTLAANLLAGQDPPADSATGKLAVSVEYTGKGTVDEDHHIWIWLFDNPDSSTWTDIEPLAVGSLLENSATYKFDNLPQRVYFAVAFDEKGGYTPGPPPPQGTPIAVYGAEPGGAAAPVTTGGTDAAVKASFDDSQRMP
jgi:hypothetical protein